MKTGPLFPRIRSCPKKVIVCQGGGDAGKTVTILQYLAVEAYEKPGSVITVTGRTIKNLKKGALRAFKKYVASDPQIKPHIESYNETDRIYTFKNGSLIEFLSFTDDMDSRGSERDILFVNEANYMSYDVFWQLQRKTRRKILLDYNPTNAFWVHEKVLPGVGQERQFANKVQLYIVDHRHNPFLTQEEHDDYENISDPNLFRVYARGLTGKIKGLIYGHFKRIDRIPSDVERVIWGIDYGYTNDPTAIVKVGIKGRKRYVKLCAYQPGLSADQIYQIMNDNGLTENDMIYSEHDPDMVLQLKVLGMAIYPARKGPGSKIAKIAKVKQYECFHTADSVKNEEGKDYFEEELKSYKWVAAQDMNTGKEVLTNIPVEDNDHACDATGYAIYTDSFMMAA